MTTYTVTHRATGQEEKLDSTPLVIGSFCGQIRRMCRFFGCKTPKVHSLAINRKHCVPLVVFLSYARRAMRVIASDMNQVLSIGLVGNVSEIANRVIGFVAINMVNLVLWPFAINIKPSQSMQINFIAKNTCGQMSRSPLGTGNSSNFYAYGNPLFPYKNTGFLVVVKNFSNALCGKIWLSHAVSPVKKWCGQRPRSVSALPGLRYFSLGVSV